jgi:1,4-dihydroxy-2-naphthoate octaprenyltransferase
MRRRVFVLTAAILFVLSWIFPVGAGLVRNPTSLPQWWGTVDIALAFAVAVAALCIPGLAHGNMDKQAEQTTYRVYRGSMHAILGVGVLVMLAGDRINWANCATGFLWRTWLFLYILPWWFAATRRAENADPDAKLQQQN